jgi:predicted metalloenzyme YecM
MTIQTLNRENAARFVHDLLEQAKNRGFNTEHWIIDHVCYRVSTLDQYYFWTSELLKKSHDLFGIVLSQGIVNGRPITTLRLEQPLKVGEKLIEAIEIPAPKNTQDYAQGFEHIEVLITTNPKEHAVLLESGKIKFHELPLSATIAIEEHPTLNQWLNETNILKLLKPWDVLLSGSIPIGVDIIGSDLDLLLRADHIEIASKTISELLIEHNIVKNIIWTPSHSVHGLSMTANLTAGHINVELFLCSENPLDQNGHRHLLSEYKLLVEHGEQLRNQVKKWKHLGLSTEESFAKALSMDGDPYMALRHPDIT